MKIFETRNEKSSNKSAKVIGKIEEIIKNNKYTHPRIRRRGNVVTTSVCTSQQHRRYVSNETLNDVSVERHQDVSVVHLHDVLLKCREDVSRGHNDDFPSVCLYDVSHKSQMKQARTSQW